VHRLRASAGRGAGEGTPSVAVVGCGAVAELNHLPALTRLGIRAAALVDQDPARARALAERFDVPDWGHDVESLPRTIDAVIVATPPSTHADIVVRLLSEGIHVLVEKPMAPSLADCERMIAAATGGGAVLAVGHMRRYGYAVDWVTELLASGFARNTQSFDIREGFVYRWPAVSDYVVSRESGAGGVLFDLGPHIFDLVLDWFGEVDRIAYADDDFGGVEADCELRLHTTSGVTGDVELSRTRNLRNRAMVRGSDWLVEIPNLYLNEVKTEPRSLARRAFAGRRGDRLPKQDVVDLFVLQLRDWFDAIRIGREPLVDGLRGASTVALIEACYRSRRPLDLPWVSFDVREVPSSGGAHNV
jgi:predicted dehydrogenase